MEEERIRREVEERYRQAEQTRQGAQATYESRTPAPTPYMGYETPKAADDTYGGFSGGNTAKNSGGGGGYSAYGGSSGNPYSSTGGAYGGYESSSGGGNAPYSPPHLR